MISLFVMVILGCIPIAIFMVHFEDRQKKLLSENFFYRSPEENQKIISRQKLLRSVLENVALVLLVLLSYWLCL